MGALVSALVERFPGVTDTWVRCFVLVVLLTGHGSHRSVVKLLRDLFSVPRIVGTIHILRNSREIGTSL